MEKMWLFSLFCLVSVPSVTGQPEDVITQTEVVRALPGTDVILVCSLPKPPTTYIIQTQWSKTEGNQLNTIAVYHPGYGTHYFTFPEASENFSVSFSTRKCCGRDATAALCSPSQNITSECNQWALHLKNITISLSGHYECSFVTYPYGTKAAKIQLIAKAEEEQHYVKEVWLNQTLEIPCLVDTASEDLSYYPLKWLLDGNGRKEELLTKEPSCPEVYRNSSVLYGQEIRLGFNNTLQIFPTKITDDGRVFSCHVVYHPERVQKSSTTVRVFAYPEISVSLQEGSAGTLWKPNVSCIVRKAFPKPSLVWYVDRVSPTEQPGEILVEQEDFQDSEGFYQLRSTMMLQETQQTHKTFSCVCLFSFLRNETWNISSEEVFVSFDNKSNEASSEAFTTMASEDLGNSAFPSAVMTTSELQFTSLASPDFTSQESLASASKTQDLSNSSTESTQRLRNATWSSKNTNVVHGSTRNTKASHFLWPTVVAILLLFCSFLIALGIRKWCQYQKETTSRPPSLKPPLPPIKYTSIVESDGTPPPCQELENL